MKRNLNQPLCPVCHSPLTLWATVADSVRAECDGCDWSWSG